MSNQNTTMTGLGDKMEHARLTLPIPQVHSAHPFRDKKNHSKLLEYLQQRLLLGKNNRDGKLDRLTKIDQSVAGWMRLSDEDRKRIAKKEQDGSPAPVAQNLPLSWVHLDDMMTFYAQTFAPNRGMFYHTGKPGEVDEAGQIVTLMNNHAIYAGYYREVLLGIFSLLKYNEGGFLVNWSKDSGPKAVEDGTGNTQLSIQLRWEGNRMESLDMYNLLVDPSVHPTKLHVDGEFAATCSLRSHYWLQRKAHQGVYYNVREALDSDAGKSECKYYRNPAQVARFDSDDTRAGTNWVSVLSESPTHLQNSGFELVEIYIRINPVEFGLLDTSKGAATNRSRYEVWRFTVLNDSTIIEATYMNNVHDYLPFFMGLINDDVMSTSAKSNAEVLTPLQDFASFLMNIHIAACRANVFGLTVYDPTFVDLSKLAPGEVAARLAVKPSGYGRDIRTAIWDKNNTLDTKQTLGDLQGVIEIINQFFPTQALPSQIAGIDRAVSDQVAAVQQGANRRQQKTARLLDDSLFRNVRFCMYYNIIQYQPTEAQVIDFFTGKPVQIQLDKLRNTDLPYIIGQGLKAIDRQAAAQMLQNVIFALIQAPQAAQQIDLLGLIDYWTSMIDIDIDMKQFQLQQQPAVGTESGGVDAQGNPIQPATAPDKIAGGPIYQ